jgi:hypothetical protein
MPVPKFKYENLHLFIFGGLVWLTAVYVAIEIINYEVTYLLSLLTQFFHN